MTIQIFRARRAIIGYPYIHESPVTVVYVTGSSRKSTTTIPSLLTILMLKT